MKEKKRIMSIEMKEIWKILEIMNDILEKILEDKISKMKGEGWWRRIDKGLERIILIIVIGNKRRIERLRKIGEIKIKRIWIERKIKRKNIGIIEVIEGWIVRNIDSIGDWKRNEGMWGRNNVDVDLKREIEIEDIEERIGEIEKGIMLLIKERRELKSNREEKMDIGRLDIIIGEEKKRKNLKREIVEMIIGKIKKIIEKILEKSKFVEREIDIEGDIERRIKGLDIIVGKEIRIKRRRIEERRMIEIEMEEGIRINIRDMDLRIEKSEKRLRKGEVDDIEIEEERKIIEIKKWEVWIDKGSIEINEEENSEGRWDEGGMRIEVEVILEKIKRIVKGRKGMGDEVMIREIIRNKRKRIEGKKLIEMKLEMGGEEMVEDKEKNMMGIRIIDWEG